MARDERQRGGARKQWVAYVTVGVISAGAALWVNRAPTVRHESVTRAGLAGSAAQTAPALGQDPNASAAGALPASLDGSSPPQLPSDGRGHLARTRAVRDFFDYFLTTQNEIPAATLDALVHRQIAAQVDGTPAADEALDVWQRYNAYLSAVGKLPQTSSLSAPSGAKPNLDALQLELDQRDALGTRLMGEWNAPFFGAESQQQHTDLARLRIASDASLSDAQKAARLAALDATLPPEVRAAHERIRQQQAALDTLSQAQAQAQKQGGSLDAMRAQITQTLGPEAAERAVKMQQADNAWQARYADYANQRAQIDKQNLPAQQRDAQVTQLRQQFFTNPSDAMRAASLDRGSGSGG
ncbi:lipase secretion chaperone [Paraburkholderia bryophila]|uniref:Lipase chaperone n=1 Tax=Paraburkholderia bryophila TaxID=420952 RepID=A0A329BIS9_9BURK|nr:lipase secretion chaperone [Paraburkholderia bryophila]RAS22128.1 lipase chaperone LimK [Paraburkholderia bryophila]